MGETTNAIGLMEVNTEPLAGAYEAATKQMTPASAWMALAESPINDDLLEWPADVFALTDLILERSEAYRFVFAPVNGLRWPPTRFGDWSAAVETAGRQWTIWLDNRESAFPDLLAEEWRVFRERADRPLHELAEGHDSRMCEALLTLHAIADEACAGLGMAFDMPNGKGCIYRARGRELLSRKGSLARIDPHLLRVLPKVLTPANGTSLRSFSRYACVRRPTVDAHWHRIPARRGGTSPRARHANLLLLPWPLRVRESDFRPLDGSVQRPAKEPFGFFEFAPAEKLDFNLVARVIEAAHEEVDAIDVVLLPESAVDESDVDQLETLLENYGVTALIAGVRQGSPEPGRLPGNWVHFGMSPGLEKARPITNATGEEWFHIRQHKHHRWSLDEKQIYQYHLGGALHPHVRWWEAVDVPRRSIHFVELGDEINMVSLVCEDLAQIDDVGEIIRSVGPSIVVTPLLDGPQLNSRWAARYAGVLADDPGSAVLTLTSFGMVQRCRPLGRASSQVIGLWRDGARGFGEIPLEPDAQGVILTVCGDRATRRSADGRRPVDNVAEHFVVAVHQVRASQVDSVRDFPFRTPAPRSLEVDELTILTGWAQSFAEAVAYDPECVERLLAEAEDSATWRVAFELPPASPRLNEAIRTMGRAIREIAPNGTMPSFEGLHAWSLDGHSAKSNLEGLVRRVVRSTLEQLRTRQAGELDSYSESGRLVPAVTMTSELSISG